MHGDGLARKLVWPNHSQSVDSLWIATGVRGVHKASSPRDHAHAHALRTRARTHTSPRPPTPTLTEPPYCTQESSSDQWKSLRGKGPPLSLNIAPLVVAAASHRSLADYSPHT